MVQMTVTNIKISNVTRPCKIVIDNRLSAHTYTSLELFTFSYRVTTAQSHQCFTIENTILLNHNTFTFDFAIFWTT